MASPPGFCIHTTATTECPHAYRQRRIHEADQLATKPWTTLVAFEVPHATTDGAFNPHRDSWVKADGAYVLNTDIGARMLEAAADPCHYRLTFAAASP